MTHRREPTIAIIGTGMGALGAATRIQAEGLSPVLFDCASHPGGHTSSHVFDGFIFDEGPHVSFTSNERIKELLLANVNGQYGTVDAKVDNYWQGRRIKHPVITNLRGLPEDLIVRIIADYVAAKAQPPQTIGNYAEWLVASYGRTYAATFPSAYGRKYHTTDASNMSTEWVGPRLYQATLEEVLTGALAAETPNVHYVQDYRYPKQGGFQEFLRPLHQRMEIRLDHALSHVDPVARTARFANGVQIEYDHLISSMPLTALIPLIAGTPRDVVEAAAALACTTVVLLNIGVGRPDVSNAGWSYFYDEDVPFSRISFPGNMSPHTVPDGMSSIQAEIYYSSKYKPLTVAADSLMAPTLSALERAGIIRADDDIVLKRTQVIEHANIIFDLDRAPALRMVHSYLDDIGIQYCGRYGEWGYLWTDEAFISGENAADRAFASTASRPATFNRAS